MPFPELRTTIFRILFSTVTVNLTYPPTGVYFNALDSKLEIIFLNPLLSVFQYKLSGTEVINSILFWPANTEKEVNNLSKISDKQIFFKTLRLISASSIFLTSNISCINSFKLSTLLCRTLRYFRVFWFISPFRIWSTAPFINVKGVYNSWVTLAKKFNFDSYIFSFCSSLILRASACCFCTNFLRTYRMTKTRDTTNKKL